LFCFFSTHAQVQRADSGNFVLVSSGARENKTKKKPHLSSPKHMTATTHASNRRRDGLPPYSVFAACVLLKRYSDFAEGRSAAGVMAKQFSVDRRHLRAFDELGGLDLLLQTDTYGSRMCTMLRDRMAKLDEIRERSWTAWKIVEQLGRELAAVSSGGPLERPPELASLREAFDEELREHMTDVLTNYLDEDGDADDEKKIDVRVVYRALSDFYSEQLMSIEEVAHDLQRAKAKARAMAMHPRAQADGGDDDDDEDDDEDDEDYDDEKTASSSEEEDNVQMEDDDEEEEEEAESSEDEDE
jgi:hypothetical protein